MRDLGLSSDAASLQFAFALWAEDLAATVPGAGQPGSKEAKREGGGSKGAKRSAPPDSTTATSSGKGKASKKAKA